MLDDPELQRLLNAHEDQAGAYLALALDHSPDTDSALQSLVEAREAVERYIDREYVRRDANRLPPAPPGSYRAARGVVPASRQRAIDQVRTWRAESTPSDRLHTLHYDDAGQVVSGVPDFEGER